MQKTLKTEFECKGTGLHTGMQSTVKCAPASPDAGIQLYVNDALIPLAPEHVSRTQLCTTIQNAAGSGAMTIEHLFAALHGWGIDNCAIHCFGEADVVELPILDGSSKPWVQYFQACGTTNQGAEKRYLAVKKAQSLSIEGTEVQVAPYNGLKLDVEVGLPGTALPPMVGSFVISPSVFETDIAPARTFCRESDVEAMRQAGLIKGGSLDCAVVFNQAGQPVNPEGLRFPDEPLRHKVLDLIGDFYICGRPVTGAFQVKNPGHTLNNKIMRALFSDIINYS